MRQDIFREVFASGITGDAAVFVIRQPFRPFGTAGVFEISLFVGIDIDFYAVFPTPEFGITGITDVMGNRLVILFGPVGDPLCKTLAFLIKNEECSLFDCYQSWPEGVLPSTKEKKYSRRRQGYVLGSRDFRETPECLDTKTL
jgi:hypothetical protein